MQHRKDKALKVLRVDLGSRSYPIYIGSGLLDEPELFRRHLPGKKAMVVTNETVAPLYLDRAMAALEGREAHALVLPDGERHKTLETASRIYDALLEKRFDRR
ncbi:MAG: 3-dehydroquinate synthase, partial [Gammaproteobacteria bacterium]